MDALSGRQILILSSIEWDAAWQRHQAFAAQWAQAGHEVFFVENTGFRRPGFRDAKRVGRKLAGLMRPKAVVRNRMPHGVHVINPVVLPPTSPAFRRVNESVLLPRLAAQLSRAGLRPGALAVAYLPTATTLSLLSRLKPEFTVYDCVDNFFGHPNAPKDLARTEGELMSRSALILTTSSTLHADKAKLHPNVLELHHGVAPEFFLLAPRGEYRRFCYFGSLWKAVDYAPIRALGEAGFEVELVGPVKEALPPLPKTVRHRPAVPHEDLPRLLSGCDALLLPYADDEYNRGVIPAKTYECLATGRPVLASPLPALRALESELYVCRRPEDWVAAARSLPRTESEDRVLSRVALAREHAQDRQFARLREAIAACALQAHGR